MNCIEATRLASESLERPLGLRERLAHRIHITYCSGCRRFTAQVVVLREAVHRLADGEVPPDDGAGPGAPPG